MMPGRIRREEYEAAKERFAGEVGAIERERGEEAERECERDACGGDDDAIEDGVPDRAVGEEPTIPIEGEVLRREAADSVAIEGVNDQHDDRQVDEREDEDRADGQDRSARVGDGFRGSGCARHLKDQRFSKRSVSESKVMVIRRMQTEIAAPSGQS